MNNNTESCNNCKHLKWIYKNEINYVACPYNEKYNITCAAAKCLEYDKKEVVTI